MDAREHILHLKRRLESLERQPVPAWERSIHEVARRAVEDRIVELGRALRDRQATFPPRSPDERDLHAA